MGFVLERLVTADSWDKAEGVDKSALLSMSVLGFLGIGAYWVWLYVLCFSTLAFSGESIPSEVTRFNQLLSFSGYFIVLVVAFAFTRGALLSWGVPRVMLVAAVVTGAATALPLVVPFDLASNPVVIIVSSLLSGMGTGVFLVAWGTFYARTFFTPLQLVCALVVSAAGCFVLSILPNPAFSVCLVVLPLASGGFCALAYRFASRLGLLSPIESKGRLEQDASCVARREPFPWRMAVALGSVGFAYGLMFNLAFFNMEEGVEVAFLCSVANVCVGAVIVALLLAGRFRFGFSSAYVVVLPVASAGLIIFGFLGIEWLFAAFLLSRVAYVLFDMLMWIQVPKVFAKTGHIKAFVIARVSLDGGVGISMLMYRALLIDNWAAFDVAAIVACAIMSVVLPLLFAGGTPENVWGLLPTAAESGHRLKEACRAMAETYGLTNREQEVMLLLTRGKNGPYIQEKLCIAQNTYQTHMRNLYRKFGIHSRQELFSLLDSFLYAGKAPAAGDTDGPEKGKKAVVR